MHDVLDPRDLVPDEAEQLATSGWVVGDLVSAAKSAARLGDLRALEEIDRALLRAERDADWPYEEPGEDALLWLLQERQDVPLASTKRGDLTERVRGAWLGRAVGNTMGKPLEGLTRQEIETYLGAAGQWPQRGYVRLLDPLPAGVSRLHPSAGVATEGRFADVPRDDDIDWTILNLFVLEHHGFEFTTDDVAAAWLDRIPFTQTYTAERAAYRNLIAGIRPPLTATHANPYREWIGALIRADVFGMVCAGNPTRAARLALVDARLSHVGNGLYAALWGAALVAAALVTDSIQLAYEAAERVVPPRSRLAQVLSRVTELRGSGRSVSAALDWVDAELGTYSWVHTLPNAAQIAIALLWGGDFTDATAISIAGGRDTDSTTATVGSVFGALHGADAIPAELVGTTHVRVRSAVRDFDRVTIDELAERTLGVMARGDPI